MRARNGSSTTPPAITGYAIRGGEPLSPGVRLAHAWGDDRREPKGDAEYLVEPVEQTKQTSGLDHLGCVLFDKFWSQAHFGQLDRAGEPPGKNFATVQAAVASLPPSAWQRVLPNERVADTTVTLRTGGVFRLIVWKKPGWRVVRRADGKPQRDGRGKVVYRRAPVIFTNLSADEYDPDQIVALYGRRWGVEDFYALGRFPATDLKKCTSP